MKFAANGFYIERYTKCANCGVLIYDDDAADQAAKVEFGGALYCTQWCVEWKRARDARKGTAATPGA